MSDHQAISIARITFAVVFVVLLALVAFGISSTVDGARACAPERAAVSANTKHTPGPWSINPADPREIIAADEVLVICRTPATLHQKRAEFNSKLLAAAPDLLEALRDMTRIASAASNGITGNQPRIARAQAAIAKAIGGTP